MRIGANPNRNQIQTNADFFHQVILPVYIPGFDDYFADGLKILRYCIDSLLLTVHSKTYITIVDNGSCDEVGAYLQSLLDAKKIHELVRSTNIGKLNAVFKGISGHAFDWVTVVDSDVMFLDGWQEATYDVFRNFPKAGAVCPTPSPKSYKSYGTAVLAQHYFSDKLKFTRVKNREGLLAFAHSVDNPDFYNEYQLEHFLTIANGDFRAVIGAGHFFVTYKARLFDKPLVRYTKNKLGGERDLIDLTVIKRGLWRLSTDDNYAYHLGNVAEPWMPDKLTQLTKNTSVSIAPDGWIPDSAPFYLQALEWLSKPFFTRKPLLRLFLKRKGLSREASLKY